MTAHQHLTTGRVSRGLAALAIVGVGAIGLTAPAHAYPVGSSPKLTVSKTTPKVAESITVTVSKLRPACTAVISVAGAALPWEQTLTANGSGVATISGSFSAAGKFTIKATVSPSCTSDASYVTTTLVTVIGKPLAPAGVAAENPKPGQLVASWTKPAPNTAATGFTTISSWKVEVFTTAAGGKATKTATVAGTATTSSTFSGLKKGTTYYVQVTATNSVGSTASAPRKALKLTK